ncbi:MFS transporter [Cucumibacter marinus]|uniref:MFS transporter n=1 Tax=Cucumibacter marinus TaxID=1121252 RepID=UPI00040FCE89|nr:MFS transporter [Cucumibacter marinus]
MASNIRLTPLILAVALFMELMDATVIATSLPAIARDINADPISLKLALTAYLVSLATFVPISSWLADRFGAVNIFRAAIAVFMLGSLACAMADSLGAFVGARFVQGMGGAMMSPLARLILIRSTPKPELVSAWAWLTIPALVGPMAGPPLGGFLTTYLSWHWIFLINIPIGLIGILAATRYLPRTHYRDRRNVDVLGFILCGASFSGLIFGMSVISMPALPPIVGILTALAGLLLGITYVVYANRRIDPIIDPAVFRDTVFRLSVIAGTIYRVGLGAFPFLMPLMLQLGFGMTPFESGMITFVGAIGAIAMKFGAQRLYAGMGFRVTLIAAVLISSALMGLVGLWNPQTPMLVMLAMLLFQGFFRSVFFTGLNAMTFSEIPESDQGQATVISAVAQQLAMAFGVAFAATVLDISISMSGRTSVELADFHVGFYVVSALCAVAFIPLLLLRADAGAEVSGHRSHGAAIER